MWTFFEFLAYHLANTGWQIQIWAPVKLYHLRVFISHPDHMQITPDTEGYLSIGYSMSTYSTNMAAAGNLGQGHSY